MSKPHEMRIARVYDPRAAMAGARLLVDRVWPRGIAKTALAHDEWLREVAPTTALRQWFGHDPARWAAFEECYRGELAANPEAVERCLAWCRKGPVTLLHGARGQDHNHALVLHDFLRERLDATATGRAE